MCYPGNIMTENFIKISYLIDKLRRKYSKLRESDFAEYQRKNDALNKIMWFTFPVVYPDNNEWLHQLSKAKKARAKKKYRDKKYIENMFATYADERLFFLTFTFSDDALKLKENTRYQYVARYLNDRCDDYLCNFDIGKNTHREHYHAVVACDYVETDFKGGHVHFERIRVKNAKRLATYVNKLGNHANKVCTGKSFHKKVKPCKTAYEALQCAKLEECEELPF